MKKKIIWIAVIVFVSLISWGAYDYLVVDDCYDHGGKWNSAEHKCEK